MPDERVKGVTGGDRAILEENWEYLDRLYQLLSYKVQQGVLPAQTANDLYAGWEESLTTKAGWGPFTAYTSIRDNQREAPFYKQIVDTSELDWGLTLGKEKAAVDTTVKEQYKKAAAVREYAPQLSKYLSDAVKRGSVTPEQAGGILEAETQLIQQGIDTKFLPNFQSVQDFLQMKAAPSDIQKWQKNNFISTPDMTPEEKGRLAEYKRTTALQDMEVKAIADWSQQRARTARLLETHQIMAGKTDFVGRPSEASLQPWQSMINFQAAKQAALGRLGSADTEDWIKRWFVEHTTAEIDPRDISEGWDEFRIEEPVGTPPTPSWLSRLAPGLQAGAPIQKGTAIPAPSGQQWSQLLPTQKSQLSGFAEWSGTNLGDILARSRMMQPKTPFVRTSWRPSRQRTGR